MSEQRKTGKAETARQSAAAANEQHIERLASMAEQLRQQKIRNADELAEIIEPLAQAMAKLTDEAREAMFSAMKAVEEQVALTRQINEDAKSVVLAHYERLASLENGQKKDGGDHARHYGCCGVHDCRLRRYYCG